MRTEEESASDVPHNLSSVPVTCRLTTSEHGSSALLVGGGKYPNPHLKIAHPAGHRHEGGLRFEARQSFSNKTWDAS